MQLSEEYIFSQLSKNACFAKIEYIELKFDTKLEPILAIDTIKDALSKFCTITDQRECYILRYDPMY
ncbi:MAG: hypothetical protein KKF44_03975 [Nanoarchaeota archaeon]|nr:hypothetical protein [Nanoarchaeota archaeon]